MGRVVRDDSQTVGSSIIPLTLAGLFAVSSVLDQSTYSLGLGAVLIVLMISAGIALMVVTPWITVGVCGLAVVGSVIVDMTFFGVAALLLPVTAGYMVVRGATWAAYAFMACVAVLLSGAVVTSEVSQAVLVSSVVFWLIAGAIALGGGHLVRYLLIREARVAEHARLSLDELRTELSRDLHDSIGGVLTRVSLLAQQARMSEPAKVTANLDQIVSEAHSATGEVRVLISRLRTLDDKIDGARPPREAEPKRRATEREATTTASEDVQRTIRRFTEQLDAYGFDVDVHATPGGIDALQSYTGVVSRLFNEALLNTVKYAEPESPVSLSIDVDDHITVRLSNVIREDASRADSSGFGLDSLSRDVATHGGSLTTSQEGTYGNKRQWVMLTRLPTTHQRTQT